MIMWTGFSIAYFLLFVSDNSLDWGKDIKGNLSLISILLRNICTFYAISLIPLWQLKKTDVEQYHINDNLISNLNILSLDVVMTH